MVAGYTTIPLVAFNSARGETFSAGDFLTRLEGLALVQTLNGELLASRSATLTLEKWCRYSTYAKDNFCFERVICGWRTAVTVLDLRLKK